MISLDADAVIGLMVGDSRLLRLKYRAALAAGETIVVSSIVLFELRNGIAKSSRVQQNREFLAHFLAGTASALAFDAEDAAEAGKVRALLTAAGRPIGPYDVLIAGQALRHGATLVTRNVREFRRVAGLKVEDWGSE